MILNRRAFIGTSLLATGAIFAPGSFAAPNNRLPRPSPKPEALPQGATPLLAKALAALDEHAGRIAYRDRLGVADYSSHSGAFRFHLVNLEKGAIERSLLVSHGRGSDPHNSGYAERFSNQPGSNATSLGSYVTGETYFGKHGRSRRLHGLDARNSEAYNRAIVVHGASYVDIGMAREMGRVGRSLGCFAFEKVEIDSVLDWLGPDRLLFATD